MKTLVVDDDGFGRDVMKSMLSTSWQFVEAESGAEAFTAFMNALDDRAPFDLITLDIGMPDMDGTEVLQKIRDFEEDKNVPPDKRVKILMVTAHTDKDTVLACIKEGCDEYIMKPVQRESVIAKLKKLGIEIST